MKQKKLHQKKQLLISDFFNDLFINGIDGVVIFFFITTGLMSAGMSNKHTVTIGIVVVITFALIMGISAYIARRAEKNHFLSLANVESLDAEDLKEKRLLENLGIGKRIQSLAQEEIEKDRVRWQNLIAKLEVNQSIKSNSPSLRSAVITGTVYILGGIIPIIPYYLATDGKSGLQYSSILSLFILFILGYFKSVSLKTPLITGAIASLFTGAFAGISGYLIAKLFIQII